MSLPPYNVDLLLALNHVVSVVMGEKCAKSDWISVDIAERSVVGCRPIRWARWGIDPPRCESAFIAGVLLQSVMDIADSGGD